MKAYLDILQHILEQGEVKSNRTGVDTIAVPNVHFSHDMSEGFPLLTTKQMAFRSIRVELEGFIKGITSKKWYQDRKCHIWDEWANPLTAKKDLLERTEWRLDISADDPDNIKIAQLDADDLGPIYGYQWRRFDETYDEHNDGVITGADQLKTIVDKLHTDPNDRRLVCSAWNPNQLSRMALPACHIVWVLTHVNGVLNLHWTQRSCDYFLGVPFNIASYALLLLLLCKEANLKPGNLSGMLCDCHLYTNTIEQARIQLDREPRSLPQVEILGDDFDIFNWTYKDVKVTNYDPCPKITAEVAV